MDTTTKTSISIPRPNCPIFVDVSVLRPPFMGGVMNGTVSVSVGDIPVFQANTTVEVQGQSSAGADKKNWKLKMTNANGDKVKLKIGDWVPSSKITLKAYGNIPGNAVFFDRLMIREAAAASLWRDLWAVQSYPQSRIAPSSQWSQVSLNQTELQTSALFSTDCHPAIVSFNGVFYGICMIRTDADFPDYLMDEKNPGHYLMQPQHVPQNPWTVWQPDLWEFTSPKKPKDANVSPLFDAIAAFVAGTKSLDDLLKIVNKKSFILYMLFCELVGSFDSINNNVMVGSWNASDDGRMFYFFPYDLDETMGCIWGHQGDSGSYPENCGWVHDFDAAISKVFNALKDRGDVLDEWTIIRQSSAISDKSIWASLRKYSDMIGPEWYAQEYAKWTPNIIANIDYCADWVIRRRKVIDAYLGYTA